MNTATWGRFFTCALELFIIMLLKIRKGQYISACTGRASVLAWCSPPEHLSSALGRLLSPFSVCTAISCCDCRFRKEWNGCCVSYNWCLIQHEFLLKVFLQLDIHIPNLSLGRGTVRAPCYLAISFQNQDCLIPLRSALFSWISFNTLQVQSRWVLESLHRLFALHLAGERSSA